VETFSLSLHEKLMHPFEACQFNDIILVARAAVLGRF
jgi:hypothetical protein